jgi:transposase
MNDQEQARRDWRIPDALWERIEPLLPTRKPHPLGCHRPRVDDRKAMDAILFVPRTGCQWNALNETKIWSSNSAHRRFQERVEADVFVALWEQGLVASSPTAVACRSVWPWTARIGMMSS